MKIGILTFHRSQNYGALLQAKALQDYVRELGHDVSFVDYWAAYHEEMYKPFSWQKLNRISFREKIKYVLQFFFTYVRLGKRRSRTRNYINQYLRITKDKVFDLVIYGSDQIWRKQHQPTYDGFNPVYWGEGFVETSHKVAYAASMGNIEIDTPEDKVFVKEHVVLYDAISIRERDLIERLYNEFGFEYPMVCDPVFLLKKEQWVQHIDKKYIPQKKYILYYRLQNISATDHMVDELHKKTDDDIIEMRGYIPFFHYGKKYRFTADAQEFISLIYGADYVVTSAFHGIAMSIIFEKQFFFTSQLHQANRVGSLLKQIGLESRFSAELASEINTEDVINYDIIRPRLEAFASLSREWLLNQITNAQGNN